MRRYFEARSYTSVNNVALCPIIRKTVKYELEKVLWIVTEEASSKREFSEILLFRSLVEISVGDAKRKNRVNYIFEAVPKTNCSNM